MSLSALDLSNAVSALLLHPERIAPQLAPALTKSLQLALSSHIAEFFRDQHFDLLAHPVDENKLLSQMVSRAITDGAQIRAEFRMVDHSLSYEPDAPAHNDKPFPYQASVTLGNQIFIDIEPLEPDHENLSLSTVVEIDKGVPATHLAEAQGDITLHFHVVEEGMVMTPDNTGISFQHCETARPIYNDPRSRLVSVSY